MGRTQTYTIYERRGEDHRTWEVVGERETSSPECAAREACARTYRSGEHELLVVGLITAHTFTITIDTQGPIVDA